LQFPAALSSGENTTVNITYTVNATDPDPLENVVNASYYVPVLLNPVNATANHTVNLLHPNITCSKTANPTSGIVGDIITYNLTVTNTGDVALDRSSIVDSLLGSKTGDFNAVLSVNASESHEYTRALQLTDPDPLDNTVTFDYTVPVLGNPVSCSANASVDIEWGNLTVFKYDCDTLEGLYNWDFTITGPGPCPDGKTNASGYINRTGLVPGLYTVTETLKAGWTNCDPGGTPPYQKQVWVPASGWNYTEFGNFAEFYDLRICKYEDANVNGQRDPAEEGLADWKFHITGPDGYDVWEYTGADGCILLEDVLPGTYVVTETLKPFWYNTTPLTQSIVVSGGVNLLEFGNREQLREIPPMVPTVSEWGIAAMIALFAGLLVWMVGRRRLAS
jgi:hypothetical protein